MTTINVTESIEAGIAFISKAIDKLKDDTNKEYFRSCVNSAQVGLKVANDEAEKIAYLHDAVIKWANQLAFILYRHEQLEDDLSTEFRALVTPETTTEAVKEFQEKAQKIRDGINAQQTEVLNHQKDLDIFKGILSGMSEEEAKEKLAEYEKEIEAAQKQLRR